MADIRVEERGGRPMFMWAWIVVILVIVAGIAWFIYTGWAITEDPQPVPVDFSLLSGSR